MKLDIVGSAPPQSILHLAHGLADVKVYGFVDDVRPFLESAAIFVCPIRDGGGTKLKILDAFAMGKCVVAHPIACEGIDVTSGRNVVLAESADEFIETIQSLLETKSGCKTLGSLRGIWSLSVTRSPRSGSNCARPSTWRQTPVAKRYWHRESEHEEAPLLKCVLAAPRAQPQCYLIRERSWRLRSPRVARRAVPTAPMLG